VLMELEFLKGRDRLGEHGSSVHSVLKF